MKEGNERDIIMYEFIYIKGNKIISEQASREKNRLLVVREKWGMVANGYRISFASNKLTFEFNSGVHACTYVLSHIPLFVTSWTVAHQALVSVEFSSQKYWRGLPFPTPGDLPDPGMEPISLESLALTDRFFLSLNQRWCFHNVINVLKTTQLFT